MSFRRPGSGAGEPDVRHTLDVNMTVVPHVLLADGQDEDTPNTPEILNSIVNMHTGPFVDYRREEYNSMHNTYTTLVSAAPVSPHHHIPHFSSFDYSSIGPNIQEYKPNFSNESNRPFRVRQRLSDLSIDGAMLDRNQRETPIVKTEEAPEEDLVRRMRRRERNKVAATKCRNKKKIKSQQLVKESEDLEYQNQSLKSEIQKLESEKRHLIEVLSANDPSYAKRLKAMLTSPSAVKHQLLMHQEQQHHQQQYYQVDAVNYPNVSRGSEPPTFAEALRLVRAGEGPSSTATNIKVEEDDGFLRPPSMNYYDDGTIY